MRAKRDRSVERYDQARFDTALAEVFEILERTELPSGTRTMYHVSPRA